MIVCVCVCACDYVWACDCVCVQAAWSVLADIAVTKVSVDTKPVIQYWTDHNHTITGQFSRSC